MRSLIIIEVEHGETTDDLEALALVVRQHTLMYRRHYPDYPEFLNYSVRVDLPECFTLA